MTPLVADIIGLCGSIIFIGAFGSVAFMLSFARIGAMVMLLPGFGETNIPTRIKLSIALLLTLIILPLHRSAYQVDLSSLTPLMESQGSDMADLANFTGGFVVKGNSALASLERIDRDLRVPYGMSSSQTDCSLS